MVSVVRPLWLAVFAGCEIHGVLWDCAIDSKKRSKKVTSPRERRSNHVDCTHIVRIFTYWASLFPFLCIFLLYLRFPWDASLRCLTDLFLLLLMIFDLQCCHSLEDLLLHAFIFVFPLHSARSGVASTVTGRFPRDCQLSSSLGLWTSVRREPTLVLACNPPSVARSTR